MEKTRRKNQLFRKRNREEKEEEWLQFKRDYEEWRTDRKKENVMKNKNKVGIERAYIQTMT